MITGSRAFFKNIKGFKPKDTDYIHIVNGENVEYKHLYQTRCNGNCHFYIVRQKKEHLIDFDLKFSPPMVIARYLTPSFAKEFNLDIEDLKKIKPLRDRLDTKHEYLGIIYDFYIKNKSFYLTDEQRALAYLTYKKTRDIRAVLQT